MRARLRWAGALAALAACVSPAAASAQQAGLPPYVAAYEPKGTDERGLWMQADDYERKLRDSKFVIQDRALNDYVRGVLCRTVGDDRCGSARIYIVRIAALNASMAPNGMMEVWSGLLLRARNEAELAAVLGHEFAHFELRHGLQGFKRARSATDFASWASVLGGASGAAISLLALGTYYSFNRDQEREADLLSMKYLQASPYDPRCFADIWERTMNEADATALGRKQRSTRYDRVAFFSTHPTTLERTGYLRKIGAAASKPDGQAEASLRTAMAPWRTAFLEDQLKLNDFGGTDYLLGELAKPAWSADLLYARGELYRGRGNPRDLVSATGFYRETIAQQPEYADAYRGLGMALMRTQSVDEGREALRRYLTLRPDAPDASMISTLLQ